MGGGLRQGPARNQFMAFRTHPREDSVRESLWRHVCLVPAIVQGCHTGEERQAIPFRMQ